MILRRTLAAIALVALVLFTGPSASAQEQSNGNDGLEASESSDTGQSTAQQSSFYGAYPNSVDTRNPHARELVAARTALDASIRNFWAVYQGSAWDYQAVWSAYYRYAYAYQRYAWALRQYLAWARQQGGIQGLVAFGFNLPPGMAAPAVIRPVAGATVTLSTFVPPGSLMPTRLIGTRTTDSQGRFTYTGLARQTYAYSVSFPGHESKSGQVTVNGPAESLYVQLMPTRVFEAQVLTPPLFGAVPADPPQGFFDPRPLAGVTVYIAPLWPEDGLSRAQVVISRVTDGAGRIRVDGINFPRASVTISHPGYRPFAEQVSFDQAVTNRRIVLMSTMPPPPIAVPQAVNGQGTVPSGTLADPFADR